MCEPTHSQKKLSRGEKLLTSAHLNVSKCRPRLANKQESKADSHAFPGHTVCMRGKDATD